MILKEKSFRVKKIKETEEKWLLYLKNADKPLEISKELVDVRLPIVRKFPWQSHSLNVKSVAGFVVCMEMDGVVLFDIPEEQWPEKVKKEVTRMQKIEKYCERMQKEYQDAIRKQLIEYLPCVPQADELEDRIYKLPVCWRSYLKSLLPMQYYSYDLQQRLMLSYWLVTIADRLYKRYIDTEDIIEISWAEIDFNIRNSVIMDFDDHIIEEAESNSDFQSNKIYTFYLEVRAELRRVLPCAPLRLEIYLVQTVCRLIGEYAEDMSLLTRQRPRTMLGAAATSETSAYSLLQRKMKLPEFESLIIGKNREIKNRATQ